MTAGATERPIIVVGCARSGTTLLQVMLHSHPRIAIPPENRFVLPAYFNRLQFGDLEQAANRRALAKFIVRRGTKFKDFGLDRRETVARIVSGPPTVGSALATVFRGYAARFDKPRWGDKRPTYHGYVDIVLRLFPDAQIVHIVRDGRDCAASLKKMTWWKRDTYHAIAAWGRAIDNMERAERRWPGVVTRVCYERLVSDPEAELRDLCAALGEEYAPAMADPDGTAAVAVPERKHWHENTRVGPTTKPIGRWSGDLEPWEVALAEHVLGDRLQRYGYELSGAGRPSARHLARYRLVDKKVKARRRSQKLADRWLRLREHNPVAAQPLPAPARRIAIPG
jgi:hypothetical protein